MKGFLQSKAAGWYFSLAAMALAIVTAIVYTVRGGNVYSPVDNTAVAMLIVGIVCNAVVLVKDFRIGAFVPFVFYTVTVGILLNTEMLFLSNVMTAIDNNALDPAWICMVVFLVLAIAAGFAATIMKISKPKNKVETVVEEK